MKSCYQYNLLVTWFHKTLRANYSVTKCTKVYIGNLHYSFYSMYPPLQKKKGGEMTFSTFLSCCHKKNKLFAFFCSLFPEEDSINKIPSPKWYIFIIFLKDIHIVNSISNIGIYLFEFLVPTSKLYNNIHKTLQGMSCYAWDQFLPLVGLSSRF